MLTEDSLKVVGSFQPTIIDQLREAQGAVETMSAAGAVNIATRHTRLAVSGTMALTLANGTVVGQRKIITVETAASTPAATLTITTPDATTGFACAATFFFDTVGQEIELMWVGAAGWRCIRVKRVGGVANNVVVGTTVLTGFNMWLNYYLSVTGTVASTTTKGIPNGSAIGERIRVGVSTAATIPSGTISLTGTTSAGAAATTLGTAAAVTNFASLIWDGLAWNLEASTVLVLS